MKKNSQWKKIMKKHTLNSLTQEHSSENINSPMTQEFLHYIVKLSVGTEILEEETGYLFFKYRGTKMIVLSDKDHNRMRILKVNCLYHKIHPISYSKFSTNWVLW